MIKILIADDHVIVRDGLKLLFDTTDDIAVVGEASCGAQVLDMLPSGQFDLLLLDLSMPGFIGTHLIERIRSQAPTLPILILSMHNELQTAKQALQAGARGFVTKGSGKEILMAAIRTVARGGRFIDPTIAERMMFEAPEPHVTEPHQCLTERELQVLYCLARGLGLRETAAELLISDKTVSTHKTHLMHKMNLHSIAELVRYAVDRGLVE